VADGLGSGLDHRVLVLAPTGKDSALAQAVFERAGIACQMCTDLARLCEELDAGAGAVIVAEEAVIQDQEDCLARWLSAQPPWSDMPVLVLARPGAESIGVARAMDLLGNVTVLERPTRVAALVSAVRTALRARQRQYQIREHLAERERAEATLKSSDRRKDEFLAILAHELRNPLAPISNALQILRINPTSHPETDELVEMMERQVNHLVRLVDDLMEVSRISRGKIELRRELVDLSAVVRSAMESSRPSIDAARQLLKASLPKTPMLLEADPVRLAQVLANLLNNAAKYTEPGGKIWLTARPEGREVTISVRDTGTGIPAHMLSKVFDPFTQVQPHAGRGRGGLGIGLTLVKNLVELHGGSVRALSDGPGKGSEFVVRLPLAAVAKSSGAPETEGTPALRLARHRLLVVDDNRDAADSMGLLLERLGAEVQVAYAGSEALLTLETFHPIAILLDIGMPGMDGHEVARRVRQLPGHEDTTLIALTGWGQREDVIRTQMSGFDYHLIKPLDLKTLEKLLSSIDSSPANGGVEAEADASLRREPEA